MMKIQGAANALKEETEDDSETQSVEDDAFYFDWRVPGEKHFADWKRDLFNRMNTNGDMIDPDDLSKDSINTNVSNYHEHGKETCFDPVCTHKTKCKKVTGKTVVENVDLCIKAFKRSSL